MEGLETDIALEQLRHSINKELREARIKLSAWSSRTAWLREAFHHSSNYTSFSWISAFLLLAQILVYTTCHSLQCTESTRSLPAEIFFLSAILVFNLCLVSWDARCRHHEMAAKTHHLQALIREGVSSKQSWLPGHYPELHMPQSPCITLQWTLRDKRLVNLPVNLLVEGDVIIMRPGHPAPASCTLVPLKDSGEDAEEVHLCAGEIYVPVSGNRGRSQIPNKVQSHIPLKPARFVLKDTPYINTVRLALQDSLRRPITLFNRERHTIIACYLERFTVPIVMLLVLIVDSLHLILATSPDSSSVREQQQTGGAPWWEHLMVRPALAVLPLLPLSLPLCWLLSNACGVAHLLSTVQLTKGAEVKGTLDHFSDVDEELDPLSTSGEHVTWSVLRQGMLDLLRGRSGHLWRSSNILQVLGSVTTFCCIDKKGILSWPNPSAEKVFFLGSSSFQQVGQLSEDNAYFSTPSLPMESPAAPGIWDRGCETDTATDGEQGSDNEEEAMADNNNEGIRATSMFETSRMKEHIYHPGSRVEVLDLTHNVSNDFAVQFDDPKWTKHISNLKPLGLSILLNTCNPKAQEHYFQFCDHITCESLHNSAAVPVMNKRCLCELAHQIGFTEGATDTYQLQQLLAVFRHVLPEVVQKGRFARSLNLSRLKMPFPYMSCAVIKDPHTGGHQLLVQGTGDLIVDACTEFWDGKGISTLAESDRKRILDFYHRSSLTAYCMAFAYAPLNQPLDNKLTEAYLELPPDCTQIFGRVRNVATPTFARPWNLDETNAGHLLGGNMVIGNDGAKPIKPCLSTDSLFLKEEEKMKGDEALLQLMSNAIFIGMVTMQYQACPDMVQFIELLEKSCIRFVHFSKENELRSRVFSEKMGLESGWNCHISLLNERSRAGSVGSRQPISLTNISDCNFVPSTDDILRLKKTKVPVRCVSAPSLVNLETFTVRFEDEVSLFSNQQTPDTSTSYSNRQFPNEDFESCLSTMENPLDHLICLSRGETEERVEGEEGEHTSYPRDSMVAECGDRGTLSHSPSRITESTDQSVPVTFDMSNRAKLPKGIENIRPHLDHVDNVPLLVSLFTDCTPEASREMIQIMQEYGEVVCCLGSSANVHNTPIFLQADVSIALEPLFPQLCRHHPVFPLGPQWGSGTRLSPTELSRQLNSLPCSFGFHRNEPISLYNLILEARHFTSGVQNCLQFLLCCCLSLTLVQLLCALFFLPPPLNASQLLWLLCLQLPLLSLSLLRNPLDPAHVMDTSRGKNLSGLSRRMFLFFVGCYMVKFVPSILMSCLAFGVSMAHFCNQVDRPPPPSPCWVISDPIAMGNVSSYSSPTLHWASSLNVCQNIVAFLLVLYFVVISAGFVHGVQMLWEKSPFLNRCWVSVSVTVFVVLTILFSRKLGFEINTKRLMLQCVFCLLNALLSSPVDQVWRSLNRIPYYVWVFTFLWPPLLVILNACVKKHEIKVNIRQQKRARLEFGTKLGMNSPF